ncbi:hypothetical protein HUG20_02980 [Salicibibacter cibi]|uniref:Uncharacterized protein n=1 Tax=Salicibibacter cibi TaxID=2743001 RepID=A0A7T6Z8W6_9BACI|nr:hypothetical protein [Salicibibacter cibi]QQK78970.1 hypothetical protein HUG20_02980 [Salicibibacter cibi]
MINRDYKKILVGVVGFCIVVLFAFSYNQYNERKMYEANISQELNNDFHRLVTAMSHNQTYYVEILETEQVTKRHAQLLGLRTYNGDISRIKEEYERLAVEFERLEPRMIENDTAVNAIEIGSYFSELGDYQRPEPEELDDVLLELDADDREKIEHVKALNSVWLEAAERNVEGVTVEGDNVNFDARRYHNYYGENSLSNEFWVDLLVDLDEETLRYLDQHNLSSIGERLE